jgi:hypothetical protein
VDVQPVTLRRCRQLDRAAARECEEFLRAVMARAARLEKVARNVDVDGEAVDRDSLSPISDLIGSSARQ